MIFLLLALFSGPLLSIWMFINSLQLIVHIPLISVYLPATSNLFLLELLSYVRLHIDWLMSALERIFNMDTTDRVDYEAAIQNADGNNATGDSSSTFYNELIHACGYHISIARNLLVILSLAFLVLFVWLSVALKD